MLTLPAQRPSSISPIETMLTNKRAAAMSWQKLSKSDGDTGIRDLRANGWTPAQVIGRAAWLAGLRAEDAPLTADEVPSLFEPDR